MKSIFDLPWSDQCRTCINFDSKKKRPYKQIQEMLSPSKFYGVNPNTAYSCREGECYVLEDGTIPYITDCKKYVKRNLSFYMKEILEKEK